jgi:hypothetical protein
MRLLPASLAALALGGCALLPQAPPPELPLLPPASLGAPHSAAQVLHAAFGERELTLQCAVQADADAVTLIALGPLGQRAFTLRYDGHKLDAQTSPYAPQTLPPQRVLSDVQLALWPLAAWQQQLAGSDWSLTEPRPGLRRLRHGKQLVAEIHYEGSDPWHSHLWLANLPLGYTLEIEPQNP